MKVNEIAQEGSQVTSLHFWFHCKGWGWDGEGILVGGEKAEDSLEVEQVLCRKADTAQPTTSRHRAPNISHKPLMFFQTETTKFQVNSAWRQQAWLAGDTAGSRRHRRASTAGGGWEGSTAAAGTRLAPGFHRTVVLAVLGFISKCPAHASFRSERGFPLQQPQRELLWALWQERDYTLKQWIQKKKKHSSDVNVIAFLYAHKTNIIYIERETYL